MQDNAPPPESRRARLWKAAEARRPAARPSWSPSPWWSLAFLAGKLIYRLRDVLLLIVVAGFMAVILNPLVVALQRWGIRRRGWAVTVVTLWGLLVFVGLAVAFGYPLVNGITHLAHTLPAYVNQAEHGRGWIGHLVRRYHVQTGCRATPPSW